MAIKNRLTTITLVVLIILVSLILRLNRLSNAVSTSQPSKLWEIQAIDTMKYSRDMAGQMLENPKFDDLIEKQVSLVAKTGATHISIGTPYDERFLPIMHRWVKMARKYNLKVWFRGNLSGWEGWFDYPKISRDEHLKGIKSFIISNGALFEDGDLFSSCPECENGGPGDPRQTGDVVEYRKFLIDEAAAVRLAFKQIDKNIPANLNSMNGDIARLVMDQETTAKLGGFVVIDHYVSSPEKLAADVREIAALTGGKIILGEYGAPIPDLHGSMTEAEQSAWITQSLQLLSAEKSLVGINYWTGFGGSTKLYNDDLSDRQAVATLSSFFNPAQISGRVTTFLGLPVANATVDFGTRQTNTDASGSFTLAKIGPAEKLTISHQGFVTVSSVDSPGSTIHLDPKSPLAWLKLLLFGK
jgi:hypothetical protein